MESEHERGSARNSGLKVVFDTNVCVSLFTSPGSTIFPIWEHALKGRYDLFVSRAIIDEVGRTLRDEFLWNNVDIVRHLKILTHVGKFVVPKTIPDVIKEDPPDNHILACAIAGKANLIVSRDLDLLRRKRYEGVGIVTPIDFLHMLEGEM
jgi:putative PIN family toxin of toxin-antitoxin system